jgi:hypothetical protein
VSYLAVCCPPAREEDVTNPNASTLQPTHPGTSVTIKFRRIWKNISRRAH